KTIMTTYSTRSMPPEIGPALGRRRRCGRAITLVAEIDSPAREIVGRDLDHHPVADAGAGAKLAHPARHGARELGRVVERPAVVAVGQPLGNGAVEFEQLFFGHPFTPPL